MSLSQGSEMRPSRRTIARGVAWAVPVIAVSAAAPAMAASGGPIVFTGISCKGPGQSGGNTWTYYMQITISVPGPGSAGVVINSITECSGSPTLTTPRVYDAAGTNLGAVFNVLPGGGTFDLAGDSTNSAMSCFAVTYTVDGQAYVGIYEFGEFKPCCTGASDYCPPAAD